MIDAQLVARLSQANRTEADLSRRPAVAFFERQAIFEQKLLPTRRLCDTRFGCQPEPPTRVHPRLVCLVPLAIGRQLPLPICWVGFVSLLVVAHVRRPSPSFCPGLRPRRRCN